MFTESVFESGSIRLNFAAGPASGPPLLFLHGITRRWQDCLTLAPLLAARWHVHALDFRGHGRSSRTPGAYRLTDYLADTTVFLHARVREPVVVYGHSLGALVAIALAAAAPGAVRALVLEDPPSITLAPRIGETPFYAMFAGMKPLAGDRRPVGYTARDLADIRIPTGDVGGVRFGDLRDPTSVRFTARCLQDLDPEVFPPLLEGRLLEGCDLKAQCRRVACSTLLLRGDDALGGMLSQQHAEEMATAMADCLLIHVPGVGHLIHWTAGEATLRYVVGFLESL
ncbi:MAG TPA: alpha/beta hydrolase [Gemmataceae bacterium]|nr:alpha/beta hydrolase [Gemmataceae bacterium]